MRVKAKLQSPGQQPTRAKKAQAALPALAVRSFKVTQAEVDILQRRAQEASDTLGRAIGQSAIVRALVRWIEQEQKDITFLVPFLEAELNRGRRWGKKPARASMR